MKWVKAFSLEAIYRDTDTHSLSANVNAVQALTGELKMYGSVYVFVRIRKSDPATPFAKANSPEVYEFLKSLPILAL